MGVHNFLPAFQAPTRAVIDIGRWVSTTSEPFPDDNFPPVDGCPQLLSRSHWHQSMGVHNLPRRAVIGIVRWVSTTFDSQPFDWSMGVHNF